MTRTRNVRWLLLASSGLALSAAASSPEADWSTHELMGRVEALLTGRPELAPPGSPERQRRHLDLESMKIVASILDGRPLEGDEQIHWESIRMDFDQDSGLRVFFPVNHPYIDEPLDSIEMTRPDLETLDSVVKRLEANSPDGIWVLEARASKEIKAGSEPAEVLAQRRGDYVKARLLDLIESDGEDRRALDEDRLCLRVLGDEAAYAVPSGHPSVEVIPTHITLRECVGAQQLKELGYDKARSACIGQSVTVVHIPREYAPHGRCGNLEDGNTNQDRVVQDWMRYSAPAPSAAPVVDGVGAMEVYQLLGESRDEAVQSEAGDHLAAASRLCLKQFPLDGEWLYVEPGPTFPAQGQLVARARREPLGVEINTPLMRTQQSRRTKRDIFVRPTGSRRFEMPARHDALDERWWKDDEDLLSSKKSRHYFYAERSVTTSDVLVDLFAEFEQRLLLNEWLRILSPPTEGGLSRSGRGGDQRDDWPALVVSNMEWQRFCVVKLDEPVTLREAQTMWLSPTGKGDGVQLQAGPVLQGAEQVEMTGDIGNANCITPQHRMIRIADLRPAAGRFVPKPLTVGDLEQSALERDRGLLAFLGDVSQDKATAEDLVQLANTIGASSSSVVSCVRDMIRDNPDWDFRLQGESADPKER